MFHYRFVYKQVKINKKMNTYEERAVEKGVKLHENLGYLRTEADRIGATMHLEIELTGFDMNNRGGYDWYTADVEFYVKGRDDVHIPVVGAKFSTSNLGGIIRRLKKAEDGIEELCADDLITYDWRAKREVMQCVISLESQLKPIIADRKKLAEDRYLKLAG